MTHDLPQIDSLLPRPRDDDDGDDANGVDAAGDAADVEGGDVIHDDDADDNSDAAFVFVTARGKGKKFKPVSETKS